VKPILDLAADTILLSKQLLVHAEASEWEEFETLDAKRQSLVRSINVESMDMTEQEAESFRTLLTEMIALNDELEVICTQQRADIAAKLKKMRVGVEAKKAYS